MQPSPPQQQEEEEQEPESEESDLGMEWKIIYYSEFDRFVWLAECFAVCIVYKKFAKINLLHLEFSMSTGICIVHLFTA